MFLNNLHKRFIQNRHYCIEVLALCAVALCLGIILWLVDAYIQRDANCTTLEREMSLRVAISEEELRAELARKEWIRRMMERDPFIRRVMEAR